MEHVEPQQADPPPLAAAQQQHQQPLPSSTDDPASNLSTSSAQQQQHQQLPPSSPPTPTKGLTSQHASDGAPIPAKSVQDDEDNIPLRLFVGQIPKTLTEDELRAIFEPYGTVQTSEIVRVKGTGESRGCGFIVIESKAAADKAIEALNAKKILAPVRKSENLLLLNAVSVTLNTPTTDENSHEYSICRRRARKA